MRSHADGRANAKSSSSPACWASGSTSWWRERQRVRRRRLALVGQSGHATGPHLHLGLKPSTSYPQDMPWFQGFAGTAFRWQDAPTPTVAAPLFAVVPTPAAADVITFTAS
jgi:hypothetical protein